jgi:hypothetical protein
MSEIGQLPSPQGDSQGYPFTEFLDMHARVVVQTDPYSTKILSVEEHMYCTIRSGLGKGLTNNPEELLNRALRIPVCSELQSISEKR